MSDIGRCMPRSGATEASRLGHKTMRSRPSENEQLVLNIAVAWHGCKTVGDTATPTQVYLCLCVLHYASETKTYHLSGLAQLILSPCASLSRDVSIDVIEVTA
jgi:hypothetical protein